jgi:hypothetical protein
VDCFVGFGAAVEGDDDVAAAGATMEEPVIVANNDKDGEDNVVVVVDPAGGGQLTVGEGRETDNDEIVPDSDQKEEEGVGNGWAVVRDGMTTQDEIGNGSNGHGSVEILKIVNVGGGGKVGNEKSVVVRVEPDNSGDKDKEGADTVVNGSGSLDKDTVKEGGGGEGKENEGKKDTDGDGKKADKDEDGRTKDQSDSEDEEDRGKLGMIRIRDFSTIVEVASDESDGESVILLSPEKKKKAPWIWEKDLKSAADEPGIEMECGPGEVISAEEIKVRYTYDKL